MTATFDSVTQPRPEVLVVEDHPTTRKLMSAWLEMSGYCVHQAQDGSEAWESAKRNCPPIVVTDWNMPRMSGLELCRFIREHHGNDRVYVLIATSRDTGDDLSKAMDAGANDFLSKPIREDEFLARIRSAENSLRRLQSKTQLADLDALTGLLNRRAFHERGQKLVDRALNHCQSMACLVLDVDLFKQFNDQFGHAIGDEVLCNVAAALHRTIYLWRVTHPSTYRHQPRWRQRMDVANFHSPQRDDSPEVKHLIVTAGQLK